MGMRAKLSDLVPLHERETALAIEAARRDHWNECYQDLIDLKIEYETRVGRFDRQKR